MVLLDIDCWDELVRTFSTLFHLCRHWTSVRVTPNISAI
jgi:hypothetical protein